MALPFNLQGNKLKCYPLIANSMNKNIFIYHSSINDVVFVLLNGLDQTKCIPPIYMDGFMLLTPNLLLRMVNAKRSALFINDCSINWMSFQYNTSMFFSISKVLKTRLFIVLSFSSLFLYCQDAVDQKFGQLKWPNEMMKLEVWHIPYSLRDDQGYLCQHRTLSTSTL